MKRARPNGINPKSVELHIDELVLHGFSPGDRYAIAEAVENELSQLFAEQFATQGVPPCFAQNSEPARVDVGAFNVAPGSNGNSIGNQIARSVHRGLTK